MLKPDHAFLLLVHARGVVALQIVMLPDPVDRPTFFVSRVSLKPVEQG